MALKGIGPFATYLIVGSVCFFLGMLFQNFPYDYFILWAPPPPTATDPYPIGRYFDIHENHVKFLHASPPLISRMMHLVIAVGILGFLMKLYRPTEANKLFDGASLALYMVGIAVYGSNIVRGMRAASSGIYGDEGLADDKEMFQRHLDAVDDGRYIGREDTLRVIAASNTILAFILIGILILQAGQWYAQRKEAEELEEINRLRDEKKKEKADKGDKTDKATKKKQ